MFDFDVVTSPSTTPRTTPVPPPQAEAALPRREPAIAGHEAVGGGKPRAEAADMGRPGRMP
jgi:hypothetical protein